jgi:hypothetical protein
MWLLRALFGASKLLREELDSLRTLASNTQHWVNKALFILLLGKYGDLHDLDYVATYTGNDPLLNRAIIVASQTMQNSKRNLLYNNVTKRTPQLLNLAKYLKGIQTPIWPN